MSRVEPGPSRQLLDSGLPVFTRPLGPPLGRLDRVHLVIAATALITLTIAIWLRPHPEKAAYQRRFILIGNNRTSPQR